MEKASYIQSLCKPVNEKGFFNDPHFCETQAVKVIDMLMMGDIATLNIFIDILEKDDEDVTLFERSILMENIKRKATVLFDRKIYVCYKDINYIYVKKGHGAQIKSDNEPKC